MPDTKLDIRGFLIPVETLAEELAAQGYVLVPAERMALASVSGYVKRYHDLMNTSASYTAAWETVEWEFQATFGCKRFESHDSFRNSTAVKKVMGQKE